jgi:dipeptidyl aminopeptidase/acylaminoacyl peptidase
MNSSQPSLVRRALIAAGVASPLWSSPSWAQPDGAAAQSVKDFFRTPALSSVVLSPDGKFIAALRDYRDRLNITVVDLSTRKALIVTSFTDGDVTNLHWVNNERLVFSIFDRERGSGNQVAGGLFVINRDASGFRPLAERSFVTEGQRLLPPSAKYLYRVTEKDQVTDDVMVEVGSMQALGKFSSDLYRVNTATGSSRLLTLGGPTDVRAWVADTNQVPRAALSSKEGTTRVHLRDSEQSPWRVIFTYAADEVEKSVVPLRFDAEGTLYVSANAGADNAAIYIYDAKAGTLKPEPVAAVRGFDLTEGLRFNADGTALLGVDYDAERSGTYWIDPVRAKIQAQIDQLLPANVNRLQFALKSPEAPVLVNSYSDRDPGRILLFDRQAARLQAVSQARPWISAERMRPTRFYRYAARDGLSIPAQLTLPEGSGKFPLVVLHYGGPWVRPIEWRWDPVVQFLASRGYAVFMPAPRASTGFGAKLFRAGWKQWGLGMQDDVTDGVQDLIRQGLVDPKRVCIAGASYGGYLTMMGLAKEPKLFRCGINWVGVTDPSYMFTVTWTDFNQVDAARYTLPLLIGDPDKDAEQFKRTSPVLRAAEIKQPVLMAYGGLDRRVPLINGESMRSALKPHNPNVEWVVYPDEGHGWLRLDNNIDFWTRVEKFLATNL